MNEFNLFTEENIPATHQPYFLGRLKGKNYLIPELLKDKARIMYECRTHTNPDYHYIEHVYTIVVSPAGNLCLLKEYRGKYYFYPYFGYKRQLVGGVSHYTIEKETEQLTAPNNIGTFTSKKVNDWLTYCDALIEAWKRVKESQQDKATTNATIIKNFVDSVPGAKVNNYENRTFVDTSLFSVYFEVDSGNQYMSTKITYKGTLQDIVRIESK